MCGWHAAAAAVNHGGVVRLATWDSRGLRDAAQLSTMAGGPGVGAGSGGLQPTRLCTS